ncbi:TlpA family protein disulfide reductase [Lederbergia galactosidilytica]|uniref:Thioredoxin domain-containing protein n=1 Tax=Lederbergia galactosidilytica TaxID=217031 RepID=A0A0Q9XU25_9BACI|nr:TlpA disulfide reductase family protein [Lederbergia galactosidilytica]KRG11766.1 hypothetical protein ACA29_15610 [Lederbergia galactosidilytica]KRG13241.1 hypothetical protein ACA30_16785 [Virgibacillus soli]MBP1915917.1 peroxiredoxin [Lederbergia galactosidilytica]OAK71216.1 hypothetical protein ABB05_10715 [Lederbergia galactosidilytica]
MKEKTLFILLTLSIGIFLYDQLTHDSDQKTEEFNAKTDFGIQAGDQAIDFQLQTKEGKTIALSDLKGKNVFINFWASWCPPCRAEMPHIQAFYEKNKENDFVVLSVNLTHLEKNMEHAAKFVEDNQLTFPVIYDLEGTVDAIYKAQTVPTSLVINKKGQIRHRIVGPVSKERLQQLYPDL